MSIPGHPNHHHKLLLGNSRVNRSSLGPSAIIAYSSSPAASSFYSSVLSGPGPALATATDCSLSLKSSAALATPHRHRLTSRFQHSKSHSISGSREATPVRIVGGGTNRRANSEKFDRQKTASLPLPKRRQLSLSANSAATTARVEPDASERQDEDDEARAERVRRARISVLNEDVFNMSTAPDTCSFVTITGTAFSNRRDSNCTLNSNSYKEQYILGSHYNNNINRHSHYDSMLRLKDDGDPDRSSQSADVHSCTGATATPAHITQHASMAQPGSPTNESGTAGLHPKPHHYETNRKSLQDIL